MAAATTTDEAAVPLPTPWMNIGSSMLCPIQGLYYPGRVLSYQGHFEFDTFTNRELCGEFGRRNNWTAPVVAAYIQQIERALVPGQEEEDDDSKVAAEVVLLFFAGEDQELKGSVGSASNGMLTPPLEESTTNWK